MMNQLFPCLLVLGNDPEDQTYHYIRDEGGLYEAALEVLLDRYECEWYPFPSFFMLEEDTERALTSLFIDAGYTRKQAENQAENLAQQLSRQDSMSRNGMIRLLKAIREKDGQTAWSILEGRSHLPGEKVSLQQVTEWKGSRRKRT
jgi:hypothetical protein